MYELMMTGCQIEIKPCKEESKGCTPSTFWMDETATIWCKNKHVGTFPRKDLTEEVFKAHLIRMIDEGFQIVIKPA